MSPEPPTARALRRAVFVDRDGTLNREIEGALADPQQLELLPGAARAIARLNDAGLAVVVPTNQSAIARGELDVERLARVHAALSERLASEGAHVDLFLHCPHHESEGFAPYRRACACRKPRPGMLLEAAQRLGLDLARSWVIGDAARDLAAGDAVGANGILVATGKGERERAEMERLGHPPRFFARDLAAAVERVLAAG